MIALFRSTTVGYFISTIAGILGLMIWLLPINISLLKFALLLVLWLAINFAGFFVFALRKLKKVQTLQDDCDMEHYIAIVQTFSKKNVDRTMQTFVGLTLSGAYLGIGDNAAAVAALSKIYYFPKNRAGATYEVAYHNSFFVYYLRIGDLPAAAQSLLYMDRALQNPKLRPADRDRWRNIYTEKQCLLHMAKEDYDGCEQVFEQAFQRAESAFVRVSAKYTLGKLYLHEGRTREAEEAFTYTATHGGTSVFQKWAAEQLAALQGIAPAPSEQEEMEPAPVEECVIENVFTPAEGTWLELAKVGVKKWYRMYYYIVSTASLFCAAFLAIVASVSPIDRYSLGLALLFLVLAIWGFTRPRGLRIRREKAFLKREQLLQAAGGETFAQRGALCYESHFEDLQGNRYTYDRITDVLIGDMHIYLVVGNQMVAALLRKDAFQTGDYDTFVAFLKEKTAAQLSYARRRGMCQGVVNCVVRTVLVFAALVLLFAVFTMVQERPPRGGEVTQSERGASMVEHEGYVYFQVLRPREGSDSLYRRTPYGEVTLLATIPEIGSLQFIGDTLILGTYFHGLHAINPSDGTITNISVSSGHCFVFTPEWIYGQRQWWEHPEGIQGEIFRIRPDGSEWTLLSEDAGMGLQLYEGQLYYLSLIDHALVRMDLDGANRKILTPLYGVHREERLTFADLRRRSNLRIHNGWVYYINDNNQLYKVQIDGQNNTSLNAYVQTFDVSGRTIVTLDYPPDGGTAVRYGLALDASSVSRMNLDGTQNRAVVRNGWAPVIVGDYVYFQVPPFWGTGELWRFLIRGGGLEWLF